MSEEIYIQVRNLDENIVEIKVNKNQKLIEALNNPQIIIDDPSAVGVTINEIQSRLEIIKDSTLSELGVNDNSEILLQHLILCGNGPLPIILFNNLKNEKLLDFGPGPKWRTINIGVSIKGKCINTDCVAYNDISYKTLGTGDFDVRDIINVKAVCPICNKLMNNVDNFGFWQARWSVFGIGDGFKPFSFSGEATDHNKFYTFQDGENMNWQAMMLNVRGLNEASPTVYRLQQ